MNNYKLDAGSFSLELGVIAFEGDTSIPENAVLNIKIESDNFAAADTMDIDIKMFRTFAEELLKVYASLRGTAVLKEAYGRSYITFEALANGHILVKGTINNNCRDGHEQELKFENEFDQSYLKDFVRDINK